MRARLHTAAYRLLTTLLPAGFRRRHADSMRNDFATLLSAERARTGTLRGTARAWHRVGVDFAGTLTREWIGVFGGGTTGWRRRASRDMWFAFRGLLRRPLLGAAIALTLALGLGTVAAAFSLARATLWTTTEHVAAPEEVFAVYSGRGDGRLGALSFPDYEDVDNAGTLAGVAAAARTSVNVAGPWGGRVEAAVVTPGYFDMLGVDLAAGRAFERSDEPRNAPREALVSRDLLRQMDLAPGAALGVALEINGNVYRVVGVTPAGFRGAWINSSPQVWIPAGRIGDVMGYLGSPVDGSGERILGHRGYSTFDLLVRARPGESQERTREHLDRIAADVRERLPEYPLELVARPLGYAAFDTRQRDSVIGYAEMVAVIAGLALLIAAANAALLQTLRIDRRRPEIDIRRALGASTLDVGGELFADAVLLSIAGGLGALALAARVDLLGAWLSFPAGIRPALRIALPELMMIAGLAGIAAMLLGTVAAAVVRRGTPTLRSASAARFTTPGLANGAVVAQVAVSVLLVAAAGLLIRSVGALAAVDRGFDSSQVLVASIDLESMGYDQPRSLDFWDRLRARLAESAGIAQATIASDLPLDGIRGMQSITVPGFDPSETQGLGHTMVAAGFFETLGIELLDGRVIGPEDNPDGERVVVVNASFARQFWPDEGALGRQIGVGAEGPWYRVVGIVADHRHRDLRQPDGPRVYWPLLQLGAWQKGSMVRSVAVRSQVSPELTADTLRNVVGELDPGLSLFGLTSLDRQVEDATAEERQAAWLLGSLATAAMLLCALGLTAVLGRWVARRRREIGIRLAIGAEPRDVVGLVVRRAAVLLLAGIALGLLGYRVLTDVLSSYLYGVSPTDTVTLMTVVAATLVLGLVVGYGPARRAARTDPALSMRTE